MSKPENKKTGYCATIGFFDGVHRGHQYVINRLRTDAENHGLGSMVITFAQHPRQVLQKDFIPKLLTPAPRKIELLEQTGVDKVTALDFTLDMARMTAREFMEMMAHNLGVSRLLIGYDNRFGHNRNEGFEDYVRHGKEIGIDVVCNDELPTDGQSISSSLIRRQLADGDIKNANASLGYRYFFPGIVVHGKGEGRKIGFPTANMQVGEQQLIPRRGVYAVEVSIDGYEQPFMGMMNIGTRPTYGEFSQTVEVNILDFDADIYGRSISVAVIDRLRDECRFESIEALKEQLAADKKQIRNIFEK